MRRVFWIRVTFGSLLSGFYAHRLERMRCSVRLRLRFQFVSGLSCSSPLSDGWCSGILRWRDCVEDDQSPTAAWAWQRKNTGKLIGIAGACAISAIPVWRAGPEKMPDPCDIGGPAAIAKVAVVADTMLPLRQDMNEEATDELGRGQCHGGVAARAFEAVIFDAEGDAPVVHAYQAAVGDSDTVGVTRQVCQHGFGSGERFLGVDNPVDFAQRLQDSIEGSTINKLGMGSEEVQRSSLMQLGQPVQKETAIQTRQHPNGQEKVFAAGDPF